MQNEAAVFGGGCFWCTEAIFDRLKGVNSVVSGYAGGRMENPSYEDVSSGSTEHAEVVKVDFDPKIISYEVLLDVFFHLHDPTTLNRQGADVGSQYRSIILTTTDDQQKQAKEFLSNLQKNGNYSSQIVTQIQPLDKFFEAEEYHKKYYDKNKEKPYCSLVIGPKLKHLEELFADKLKSLESA